MKIVFRIVNLLVVLWVSGVGVSCNRAKNADEPLHVSPAKISGIEVEVLHPAGSVVWEQNSRKDSLNFLPWPAHWCFIPDTESPYQVLDLNPKPSTRNQSIKSANQPAFIPALVLGSPMVKGEKAAINLIGALLLERKDSTQLAVIVGIPQDEKKRSCKAAHFADFTTNYYPVQIMLEQWFSHALGYHTYRVLGWRDEHFAGEFIKRHTTN